MAVPWKPSIVVRLVLGGMRVLGGPRRWRIAVYAQVQFGWPSSGWHEVRVRDQGAKQGQGRGVQSINCTPGSQILWSPSDGKQQKKQPEAPFEAFDGTYFPVSFFGRVA